MDHLKDCQLLTVPSYGLCTCDFDQRATNVVEFKAAPRLYEAKSFEATTRLGQFAASGTLCGHIDFIGPFQGCYPLSPDEAFALIVMLQQARADVLENSNPNGDPRLFDRI